MIGLRSGWVSLFIFVWLIGAFLGSTFEYQSSANGQGISYTTGTATFTNGSNWVTSGGGATWDYTMDGGNIKADIDTVWHKMRNVGGGFISNITGVMHHDLSASVTEYTPATLIVGVNTVTVTTLGTFTITLPVGNTGTATSGIACLVTGSPLALVAGNNTITTTSAVGNITITTVGTTQAYLYSPYSSTGGINLAYTMAQSPGWAGSGTAGYTQSPITTLQYLTNLSNAFQRLPLWGTIPIPIPNGSYFQSLYRVLTWQWSFMTGAQMFYWIFCAPFVLMGVISLIVIVYGLLRGNISLG